MAEKTNCAEPGCDHVIESHHKEYTSSGDVTNPDSHQPKYFSCLAAFCKCMKYVPPRK